LPAAKKSAPAPKAAPKAKTAAPAKKAPAAVKKAAPPPKAAKAPAKAPAPAPKPAAPKAAAPAKPVAKGKAVPPPKAPAKKAAAPAPAAKKPEPKPSKAAKPAPEPKKAKAAPEPKPAPVKAEKPAKPPKAPKEPKPPKPPKLAPVEAAFAKPKPAKPLAVAAGRAQPVTRAFTPPPPKVPPKPLSAPKPVVAAAEPELVGDLHTVPAFKGKTGTAKGMVMVGAIAGAFGVKGEVRLRAFTDKKEGVISYGPLYGEDGKVLLKPKNWRELKDGVAVVAAEVKSREQAEQMKGQKLFVPRANLPATAEDEFYVVDLLGSRAEALDGTVLGDIVAVWNFGAGDIIEYRPPNGGPNVRITFTKETVPHVDLAAKRVVIDPPAPEPVGK
jgi:16S rRNA processing protein RimM